MYSRDLLAELYRTIYKKRLFEARCVELQRLGLIIGYFRPCLG